MSEKIYLTTYLHNLEINGYSDVLPEKVRPAVVEPIYRPKVARYRTKASSENALVPPFTTHDDGYVIKGTWIPMSELEALAADGQITLFPPGIVFEAKAKHTLWIDIDSSVKYEPTALTGRK